MNLQLEGKRVLVTGGSRGIGRATVRSFAGAGAHVVTCHRGGPNTDGALDGFDGGIRPPIVVRADVRSRDDVAWLAGVCRQEFGGLDVVVNNAGVDGHAAIRDLPIPEWNRVMATNVTACYQVVQAVLPLLAPVASIVCLGASVALRGRPGAAHYTASKAAVLGLVRSLAKELGPQGIRVNAVSPGVIEAEDDGGELPPAVLEHIKGLTALGRLGAPEDVVGAVLFLASDLARYITGATLHVDGGM